MPCPACNAPTPDGAAECASCGLIFAKWKGASAPAPPPTGPVGPDAPLPTRIEPVPGEAPANAPRRPDLGTWALVVALACVVAGVAYFLMKPSAPAPAKAPRERAPFSRLPGGWPTESEPPTPTPGPTVLWRFEGKVYDILHQVPIEGVTVTVDVHPPVMATTDGAGFYSVEASVAEGATGVYIWLGHPDFGTNYWAGDHTKRPYEERVRMYGSVQFQGTYRGKVDGVTTLDFSMFPEKLTEEERTRIHDTLYPPARD